VGGRYVATSSYHSIVCLHVMEPLLLRWNHKGFSFLSVTWRVTDRNYKHTNRMCLSLSPCLNVRCCSAISCWDKWPEFTIMCTYPTRKPCCRKETARCRKCSFPLKFANNIHYKYKTTSQASKAATLQTSELQSPNMLAQNAI